jgi:hypothetical protein
LSSVVLPLPRKPVRMVTGIMSPVSLSVFRETRVGARRIDH